MSRNPIAEAIANPARHPRIFLFVLTFGLGIATNGLSTLVLESFGDWVYEHWQINKLLWQVLVIVGITALIGVWLSSIPQLVQALWRRPGSDFVTNVIPMMQTGEPTCAALITVMGLTRDGSDQIPAAETSIRHHWGQGFGRLGHCWLITTPQSIQAVPQMLERLHESGVPIRVVHSPGENLVLKPGERLIFLYYGDAYSFSDRIQRQTNYSLQINNSVTDDPNHMRQLVDYIYADAYRKDLLDSDIIADYTGGTKSMTAGIVLACTHPDRRLQYISQQSNEVMEVTISYNLKPVAS